MLHSLLEAQKMLYIVLIALMYQPEIGKIPLTLLGLLCKNMAFVGVLALDLSGSGKRESLFCSRICLHFWHF